MSFQAVRAFGFEARVLSRSLGSLCIVPPSIFPLVISNMYFIRARDIMGLIWRKRY